MSESQPLIFARHGMSFVPANDNATNAVKGLSNGQEVCVNIKQPRNLNRHKLYWAMIAKIVENWPDDLPFKLNKDSLHQWIKISTGYVTVIKFNGKEFVLPRSISFNKMSENEFCIFLTAAKEFLCTEVIPGLNEDDLMNEVVDMI